MLIQTVIINFLWRKHFVVGTALSLWVNNSC
jgi:hypothetical protein